MALNLAWLSSIVNHKFADITRKYLNICLLMV